MYKQSNNANAYLHLCNASKYSKYYGYYLIGSDMKVLDNSHVIQLINIFQVLKIVIVIIVVYAEFHLFTQLIWFTLQHQQFAQLYTSHPTA